MTLYNILTDFGAGPINDGVTDATPAVVNAIEFIFNHQSPFGDVLYFPAGTYKFISNPLVGPAGAQRAFAASTKYFLVEGLKKFKIIGDGKTQTIWNMSGYGPILGTHSQKQNGDNFGAIQTVAAGSYTAQLKDPNDHVLFVPDQWVNVTGINQQDGYSRYRAGYGYPANHRFFEFIQIDSVNRETGLITFRTPLTQGYKETWPMLNIGNQFEVNAAGQAGIYSYPLSFDIDMTWEGIQFVTTSGNQLYAGGRRMLFKDCMFPGTFMPIPTQNDYWGAINCNGVVLMEVDKYINVMEIDGGTWRGIDFQSSSVRKVYLRNATFQLKCIGLGIDAEVENCVFQDAFSAGPWAYGVGQSMKVKDCSVAIWQAGSFTDGGFGRASLSQSSIMEDNIIKIPTGRKIITAVNNNGYARFIMESIGGWRVGMFADSGNLAQFILNKVAAPIGSSTLTFDSVPEWILPGMSPLAQDSASAYNGIQPGSKVLSKTATTIKLDKPFTAVRAVNSALTFYAPISQKSMKVVAIPDNNTIDTNLVWPPGYEYSFGNGAFGSSAVRWAVPGSYCYWLSNLGKVRSFKVEDVYEDEDYTYVKTNEVTGGFPYDLAAGVTPGVNGFNVAPFGALHLECSGLTGASPYNASLNHPKAQGKPFGSYSNLTITGGPTTSSINSAITSPSVWGHLVSFTVNVKKAYTGNKGNLYLRFHQFDRMLFNADGTEKRLGWRVHLNTVGKRVVLPTNMLSNPTQAGLDSALTVPVWKNVLWYGEQALNLHYVTNNQVTITDEDPSVWPEIEIEIITDPLPQTNLTKAPVLPDADISDGNWTTDTGGTNLFPVLAKTQTAQADDTFIKSGVNPLNDICVIRLGDPPGPVKYPATISYRYQAVGAGLDLRVRLLQGGSTEIASWTHTNISTSVVTAAQTLTGLEFNRVTDWSDLTIEIRATK